MFPPTTAADVLDEGTTTAAVADDGGGLDGTVAVITDASLGIDTAVFVSVLAGFLLTIAVAVVVVVVEVEDFGFVGASISISFDFSPLVTATGAVAAGGAIDCNEDLLSLLVGSIVDGFNLEDMEEAP